MKSIDEVENMIQYLESLENSIMEIIDKKPSSTETSYETNLKLRLGKPSLDWLLDHFPEPIDLSKSPSLDETLI